MTEVLGEVLPLAVAIAASPFTIIPAILLLFTPRARATSATFLVGWLLGISLSTAAATALAAVVERAEQAPTWASWTRIVLGLVLVVLGVRQWLSRHDEKPAPAWMRSIATATPATGLRLALVLSVANPKVLLLSVAAGLTIGAAELATASTAAAIGAFTVVAASTVAAPVLLYALRGERMLGPLGRARDWLVAHNAVVMSAVLALIGIVLVVEGVTAL